jgi:hypothetical protein
MVMTTIGVVTLVVLVMEPLMLVTAGVVMMALTMARAVTTIVAS